MDRDAAFACWAKTARDASAFHPLISHMLDSAAVSYALGQSAPPSGFLEQSCCAYIVALHDIGKADPRFQNKDAERASALRALGLAVSERVVPFRHESRSSEWVRDRLAHCHSWGRASANLVSQAVRGHHGRFGAEDQFLDCPDQVRPEWNAIRQDLAVLLAEALGVTRIPEPGIRQASAFGAWLSGRIVLCDWIASNEELYRYWDLPSASDPRAYFEAASDEASRAVGKLRLGPGGPASEGPGTFASLWPQIRSLRPVQAAVEEACLAGVAPGMAIIEAPMGDGKTEAAICLAEQWRRASGRTGTYIALPTAATSNQMHSRYQAFLSRWRPTALARLVHGMAWLVDDSSPSNSSTTWGDDASDDDLSREWFRNARRALLSPEAVGTVDQALMTVLNVKFGFLRLFGLSHKVLIVDEVHAYDAYMSTILCRLLQWCRAADTPVILLSATLSSSQKSMLMEAYGGEPAAPPREPEPYPLLTLVPLVGEPRSVAVHDPRRRRVALRVHHGLLGDLRRTAFLALQQVEAGGCACVIANSVADAQGIYAALKEATLAADDLDLTLFHARFRAASRQRLEEKVTALFGRESGGVRPRRAVLVATQVVEQSLDVDFDVMISQVAPVDLLLQRSGRLHRHDRGARPTGAQPTLHVLLPESGSFDFAATERIYQKEPLLRTLALIRDRESLDLPADFRRLIEGCYGDLPIPDGGVPEAMLTEAARLHRSAVEKAEGEAHLHLIPEPSATEFRLAYNPQQPVSEGEDGATRGYFHAQTRLGDPRTRVLVIHDARDLELMRSGSAPDGEAARRLFLQMADLPAWWIDGLSPEAGFDELTEAPGWLNRLIIVAMHDGEWRGKDGRGRPVAIRDHPELGLRRETRLDARPEEALDADV